MECSPLNLFVSHKFLGGALPIPTSLTTSQLLKGNHSPVIASPHFHAPVFLLKLFADQAVLLKELEK